MTEEKIKCPNCGADIPISEVLTHQIKDKLKVESVAEIAAEKKAE